MSLLNIYFLIGSFLGIVFVYLFYASTFYPFEGTNIIFYIEYINYYLTKNPSDKKIHIETNDAQISLTLEQESLIKKEISSLDLYNTSPVEVIKKLEEIKKNHGL